MEVVPSGNKIIKPKKIHFTRSSKTKSFNNRNHISYKNNRTARSNSLRSSFKNNVNRNKNNAEEVNNFINNNGNEPTLLDEVCFGEFTR